MRYIVIVLHSLHFDLLHSPHYITFIICIGRKFDLASPLKLFYLNWKPAVITIASFPADKLHYIGVTPTALISVTIRNASFKYLKIIE